MIHSNDPVPRRQTRKPETTNPEAEQSTLLVPFPTHRSKDVLLVCPCVRANAYTPLTRAINQSKILPPVVSQHQHQHHNPPKKLGRQIG